MIHIKYLKYLLLPLIIAIFAFLPLKVYAEEQPIEVHRKVSLTYADVTAFQIYQGVQNNGYSTLVYLIEDFFDRFNIENTSGLYPYGMTIKSELDNYITDKEQLPVNYLYYAISGSYDMEGNFDLIVNNNNLYIIINSRYNPYVTLPSDRYYIWTDFKPTQDGTKYIKLLKPQFEDDWTAIIRINHKEYFNTFGFYVEFTQYVENPEELDYDTIYQYGFDKGREQGRLEGDAEGYSRGYKAGKEYGLSIADGEVNALASIIPNIVGTIWGVIKDFLTIEVYGISPWQIFAVLSSVALVILAIKIIR